MAASYVPVIKNGASGAIFYVALRDQSNTKVFKANPTIAAGDFKVSIDGAVLANLNTLPAVAPAGSVWVKITLSQAEVNGDNILVQCIDAAGAEWCDLGVDIQTVARQINDLAFPNTTGRGMDVDASGGVELGSCQIGAITNAAFASGAIDAAAIAANAIGASEIAADAITAAKIADGAIDAATFAAGAIDATAIASNAITAAKIAANAITASQIAADAITSSQLAASAASEIATAVAAIAMADPSAVPAVTATLQATLSWLLALSRNKLTQTATTATLFQDDAATPVGTATVSDDGVTAVRGEWG